MDLMSPQPEQASPIASSPEVLGGGAPMSPLAPDYTDEQRKALGGDVESKYTAWRAPRRPYELQWFISAAYRRGKHTSESVQQPQLRDLNKLDKKKKNIANKLWAKGRARFAKFVRTRPKPVVIPFTHERKDRLNARITERALDYQYERLNQEEKYSDVLLHAQDTGKAYWWLHWNPDAPSVQRDTHPVTNEPILNDIQGGDIELEVGSAFEVLVPDLHAARIGDQPEMMRVRVLDVEMERKRYPQFAERIKPDAQLGAYFEFERQIAHLSGSEAGSIAGSSAMGQGAKTGVVVKELYVKPNAKFPKGRQIVAISGWAVKIQDELPYGFWDMENPYPVVEFSDMPQVGQFYATAFIEHLIPLQRGYNMLRDKLEMQIKMNVHPKWLVPKQARIPKGSLTNEAAEVVEWVYIPGMPEPHPVTPGNIVADAWRFFQLLKEEFDDISQVYPSFEGKAGSAKSGFQTNLLQEASDNVHSPDARGFELAIKDSAYKMRRMMKAGYDIPRLISFSGRSAVPEVFEFSGDNIDEHAVIKVQIGSGLSQFKAARVQQLLDLYDKGLLGDINNPEVKRRVLSLVDMGGVEEFQERAARDEDLAQMENLDMLNNGKLIMPDFYHDHMVHYAVHTDELKNPANKDLDPQIKKVIEGHAILHMKWFNPVGAYQLAMEAGLSELVTSGLIPPPPPAPLPPGGVGQPSPLPQSAAQPQIPGGGNTNP